MEALLIPLAALVLYMSVLYVVSLVLKNNGVADVGYGIAFLVVIGTALLLSEPSPAQFLIVMPLLWAPRLAYRIFKKNYGKPEDFRYRAWREAWGKTFLVRSFLQVYLLQGTVVFFVALPVTFALLYPAFTSSVPLIVGVFLWCVGFAFEVIGDAQLDRFIRTPENKGKIMMQGLWKYSRHPNYFGESMMWWGVAIAAMGLSAYPLVGFVSPLLITFLLLKVSGVPLLEKRWEGNPEWEAYTKRTSVFFPLPPKA